MPLRLSQSCGCPAVCSRTVLQDLLAKVPLPPGACRSQGWVSRMPRLHNLHLCCSRPLRLPDRHAQGDRVTLVGPGSAAGFTTLPRALPSGPAAPAAARQPPHRAGGPRQQLQRIPEVPFPALLYAEQSNSLLVAWGPCRVSPPARSSSSREPQCTHVLHLAMCHSGQHARASPVHTLISSCTTPSF